MAAFFYGTLCDDALLETVLGRKVEVVGARLPDHKVLWSDQGAWPVLVGAPGAQAPGLVLEDVTDADLERLDFYEAVFGYGRREALVEVAGTAQVARLWLPDQVGAGAGDWSLADWQRDWGAVAVATAGDVMALRWQHDPAAIGRRYRQMLVRGASRVRAAASAPTTLRRRAEPGDVVVEQLRQPYGHFFAVEEYDMRFRRFDGGMSEQINRAVFLSGDAVTVLPYDPMRDRVLLVEQFRAAVFGRGDAQPWQLEAIAGRIDPDEGPEQAARREAVEEAGLELGALEFVARFYPSPGAKSEYLYSYVALCDLPDGVEGVFGVESEAEDIRGHLVGFAEFIAMVSSGEIENGPLLVTALWLQRERGRLRGM
ncbi:nudix-type nucleoside diphosphatase, YffH/AdpP family [Gemmobacter aquatilis]|uniref:ADP-ribose pyrophosphatase n=1 Tax=Gemmobacter aquatilis TaxID=933059 RepID=A0A1H8FEP1_9RHOB|nr:NUDIX domain-containing protein [Gemmobacter aquatilis]SEN30050.1 nudix-type nucleoside diphosphatase, YffH/AdpP family [Gemmobacter aquatilis]